MENRMALGIFVAVMLVGVLGTTTVTQHVSACPYSSAAQGMHGTSTITCTPNGYRLGIGMQIGTVTCTSGTRTIQGVSGHVIQPNSC